MSKHRIRLPPHLPGPSGRLRIGVMGGTFDPPHTGHIHLIETARRRLQLDWVWIFPARGNPLKHTATDFADRFTAAVKTLSGPRARVSAMERELGLTYTIELVAMLQRLAPQARFVWIMGGDNLRQFHRWRDWRAIAARIPIAILSRPIEGPTPRLSHFTQVFARQQIPPGQAKTLADRAAPAWVYLPAPLDPTSSTSLRARILLATLAPTL